MSLNDSPRSVRTHIALFGKRNAGKSSIINAITNQEIAIVSEVRGTTTDPVYKSMEILPIGPCVIIDTAGTDDLGILGELRIKKTMEVLNKTDVALLVIDASLGMTEEDRLILYKIKGKKIPVILVINKADIEDISSKELESLKNELKVPVVTVSAVNKQGIRELKEEIIKVLPADDDKLGILGDLISAGDFVVLVTPIDSAAPKGRLILPQQQTVRDILDNGAIAIVTKESELKETLKGLSKKPSLVITDSQAFAKVDADIPKDIPMTSFSILFARLKGDLTELIKGARAVRKLKDGDKVLISEGCTHHKQGDDIGSVKIPRWLKEKTDKNIEFEFSAGSSFTEDVKKYSLIVHCGACMLNSAAMMHRIESAKDLNVPIVNYGVLIAYLHGILDRALEPFPQAKLLWEKEGDI
jgi:[FeFe] hydrogenase H-cluster maturation GTPase HydF